MSASAKPNEQAIVEDMSELGQSVYIALFKQLPKAEDGEIYEALVRNFLIFANRQDPEGKMRLMQMIGQDLAHEVMQINPIDIPKTLERNGLSAN